MAVVLVTSMQEISGKVQEFHVFCPKCGGEAFFYGPSITEHVDPASRRLTAISVSILCAEGCKG